MAGLFGSYGAWQRVGACTPAFAAGVEELGYTTLWVGGSPRGDLGVVERALDATASLVVATGIVNIWKDDAAGVAAAWHRISDRHPGRFVLGVGVGHPETTGPDYRRPMDALQTYLDVLDAAGQPADRRVIAALGPRALRLAAGRSAGAHPYLTTPQHTRQARAVLGDGPVLAPEHKVVLVDDPDRARAVGRPVIRTPYLSMVNYTTNLRRLGYTEADLVDGGSDRLIDDLLAHGDAGAVADRLAGHLAAGADHVAVQVLTPEGEDLLAGYRALTSVLG